ncbi:hypothetical protein [Orientia tsutsugamushi]|uniref:hypothetical protein n=1 Tax=Orientia tsutsugamushi TaxID=784 RepID=UPI000D5A4C7C|nr:Uncharacterised protein [Orientia tsutsugamushi]
MDITKDAVVELCKHLLESVKSALIKLIFVLYEKSKTLYQDFTKDLMTGQKFILDLNAYCILGSTVVRTVEVGGGAVAASNGANILKKQVPH